MVETTVTPRPWPENAEPTDDQLASYLGRCTHAERVVFVQKAQHHRAVSMTCFMEDHEHAVESYKRVYEELRDRQDRALSLLMSFDPTSGSGRARTFVADLRNVLGPTHD